MQTNSNEGDPIVAVILTAYNRDEFILEALNSVLSQSLDRSRYEVVIVKNFKDQRVDKIASSNGFKNLLTDGQIGDFLLRGVNESSAKILTFLDDDDKWYPQRLERIISIMTSKVDIGYYHNRPDYIGHNGAYTNNFHPSRRQISKLRACMYIRSDDKKKLVATMKGVSGDFNLSCIAIRRSLIEPYLSLLSEMTGYPDGLMFYLSLLSPCSIFLDSKVGTSYRLSDTNSSITLLEYEKRANSIAKIASMTRTHIDNPTYSLWLSFDAIVCQISALLKHGDKSRKRAMKTVIDSLRSTGIFGLKYVNFYPVWTFAVVYTIWPVLAQTLYRKIRGYR